MGRLDGMFHGQGKCTNPNGEVYVGKWKNGLRHEKGYGTIIYPKGEKYVGEFMHGKEHGQGTFSSSNFFYDIKSEHF